MARDKAAQAIARRTAADTSEAVDRFMAELTHPCKAEVQALRQAILAAGPSIAEGVKWNAPSYRISTGSTEYFATTHLRAKSGIGLVLHRGAKARALPDAGLAIDDPAGLLQWLAADRAMIAFRDLAEVHARTPALQALLRAWIRHV